MAHPAGREPRDTWPTSAGSEPGLGQALPGRVGRAVPVLQTGRAHLDARGLGRVLHVRPCGARLQGDGANRQQRPDQHDHHGRQALLRGAQRSSPHDPVGVAATAPGAGAGDSLQLRGAARRADTGGEAGEHPTGAASLVHLGSRPTGRSEHQVHEARSLHTGSAGDETDLSETSTISDRYRARAHIGWIRSPRAAPGPARCYETARRSCRTGLRAP